ncbi:MAG: TolC family protein [Synechococcus sp.]|nr:TolC family protein [Synechococcus sp.]
MVSPVAGLGLPHQARAEAVLPGAATSAVQPAAAAAAQAPAAAAPASPSGRAPLAPAADRPAAGAATPAAPAAPRSPAGAVPAAAAAAGQDPPTRTLPLAPAIHGARPLSNPTVLAPAAGSLPPELKGLTAPASLALPDRPSQVRIRELRPLGMAEVETLAEVNNPNLRALAIQVDQAQSALRAEIALWYPQISLNANALPSYSAGEQSSSGNRTVTSILRMQTSLQASWSLINPARSPRIAAARDLFERSKNQYLIGLRDLRLQASRIYFDLQEADEQVRIGQESVRSSQVSLRDARARFQAGVATKLEVLQAETQLARDQQLLTNALSQQAVARRTLAALLNLPQDVTPTAKDPSRVIGTWLPSLQESIVAAFAFREELDQALLDISASNSRANAELARAQPLLSIVNTLSAGSSSGYEFALRPVSSEGWSVENTIGLNLSWNLFSGGQARALYRQQKQVAEESRYRFAERRIAIRQEVEESFYNLQRNNRNILTTSREVLSARESLRLARLRFQAGVTTQREVVDTQRDLTQAEVRYSTAIADYNRNLAELRRRTGLDQIAFCDPPQLPAQKPDASGVPVVPVEPQPLLPACAAKPRPAAGQAAPSQP